MIHNMTMNKVNIHEAKAKLSEYVDAALRGEQVVICRRNRPVVELRPVGAVRTKPRPIGGAQGRLTIPAAFLDPLPDDLVDAFYEEPQPGARSAPRVAERPASHRATRRRRSGK
jgi:prevent-host-death family protein